MAAGIFSIGSFAAPANVTVKSVWKNEPPHTSIIAVTQSRDGYLWLGTFDGLARFDGEQFKNFDEEELPGLSSGPVSFLFTDSRGDLWVGTDTAGVMLIKQGQVRPLDIGTRSRAGRLVGAAEAADGTVWLATANGQLCHYHDGHMEVWGPLFSNCRGLMLEKTGRLWLRSDTELFRLETSAVVSGKDLPTIERILVGQIDSLLASQRGGFWLLAYPRILKYVEGKLAGEPIPYPWGTNAVLLSAFEDSRGNLIVGVRDRGLTWFAPDGKAESLTSENGLSHNTPLALHEDHEGSLWVGTDGGGLNRVKPQCFRVLEESRSASVQSVCEDADGGLWFAPNGGQLKHFQDGKLRTYGNLTDLNLRSVFVDRDRKVWIGTFGSGLLQLEGENFQPVPGYEKFPRDVTAIHQDRGGTLWVGTAAGLVHRREGVWKSVNALAGTSVSAIADDAAGNIWVGTPTGLGQLRGESVTMFREKDGLSGDAISALLVDASGALWVGTRNRGLTRMADGKWTPLTKREGLASNKVNYLAEDAQGGLWVGSSSGLMRVEKQDLDEFISRKTRTVRCRTFGSADGLLTGQGAVGSQPAAWRGREGTMWFATTRGLGSVNPAQIVRNTNLPPVMIERVLVDDVLQNANVLQVNWPTEITIPAGKERLEIHYTSLNLAAPDRARFKYQLEGHESGWTEAGREAHFSNLSPDRYVFRVIACNEDGVWNNEGATLTIIVEPPFWRTWWFLTFCGVALLGGIVATVHFISTQKLQRQLAQLKQQEALERERARIARDLHDQLGANLTQVSLLGELVETDKNLPEEVEGHAKQISRTARTTAAALDEIVWAANPSNDTLDSLVTYACKYAQEYFALAGVSYRLEVPGNLPVVTIPPEVRHNVFLAFKECVNNVVKHAQASAVKVRLVLAAAQFTLEVEDNGRGLPPDARDKGRNGLRNMRKRMEDVGGAFTAGPAPERGTLVRLTAPLGEKTGDRTGN